MAPEAGEALFVLVGFRDDRRLAVVLTFVVFVLVIIIVVVGVSRRHRVAQDGNEATVDQACGEVLGDARDHVGLPLDGATSLLEVRLPPNNDRIADMVAATIPSVSRPIRIMAPRR
jgi:hypothetical protein